MAISGIRDFVPNPRTLLALGLSSLLGAAVAIGVSWHLHGSDGPPGPPRDPRFVSIGRAYLPELGKAYAAAWEEGARGLESGQPVSAAITDVGRAWETNRARLFDRMATPAFAGIVPESQKDAEVTAQQRGAMAAAWRGLAAGLGD